MPHDTGTIQIDFSSMAELRLRFIRQMSQIPNRYFAESAGESLRMGFEEMAIAYGVADSLSDEPMSEEAKANLMRWFTNDLKIDPDDPLSFDKRRYLQHTAYVLIRKCDPIENFPPIYHDGELVEILAHGTLEEMRAYYKKGTFDSSGYVPLLSLEGV